MGRRQSESLRGVEEKRNGRLIGAAETSKKLADWQGLLADKLEQTVPTELESVVSATQNEQLASTFRAVLTKKKQSHQSRSQDSEMGMSQGD